jgi:O-antigen ligase
MRIMQQMTTNTPEFFFKLRKPLFALLALGLGSWTGQLVAGSADRAALTCSLLVLMLYLLVVLYEPLMGLLAWVFFLPFIDSWIELPLGNGIPDLSFGRFAIVFLIITLLVRTVGGRFHWMPVGLTDLCVLLMPMGFALSVPLADEPLTVIQQAISLYFIPAVAYFFAKNLIRTGESLHSLLWVIALFGSIAGAHALYEFATGHVLFIAKELEVNRLYREDTSIRLIVGLIGSTGAMGRVLVTTLLTTIYLILQEQRSEGKPFLIGGAVLQFGGLLITFSRTPILSLFAGLLLLQLFYPALRKMLLIMTIVAAVGLGMQWGQIQRSEVAQDRFTGVRDYNGRSSRWQAGYAMWLAKPVRGWGMGQYEKLSGDYRTDGLTLNLPAVENDYLFILVSAGLIGFVPYALFLGTIVRNGWRLFWQARRPTWPGFLQSETFVLCGAVLLCFLINSYTAKNSYLIVKLLPFVIAGGVVGSHEFLLTRAYRSGAAARRGLRLPLPSPGISRLPPAHLE